MSFRDDITIDWSLSPRIIEVAASEVGKALTIQDLYDTVRTLAAQVAGMDDSEIIDGGGKEYLTETESVGLTVKLLNAKVKFAARTEWTSCTITGGNLVAVDGTGSPMNPVQPSAFVNVDRIRSTSGTLVLGIVWQQS